MRNYFTFGETPSTAFGVYVSGSGVFNAPTRAYEPIQIPGRSGDVLSLSRRLENVEITYPAFIYTNFKQNIANFRDYLLSKDGYHRLADTYNPDEFRLAYYAGGLELEMERALRAGQFEVTFNCKPQRYLVSGTEPVTFTANGSLTNPTKQAAAPLIRVYGTGTVGIGDNAITVMTNPDYIDIDCEIMEAYYGPTIMNEMIHIQNRDFPVLHEGNTGVSLGSGITSVIITPRWWRA